MRPSKQSYFQPVSPWILATLLAVLAIGSEGCFRRDGAGVGADPSGGEAAPGSVSKDSASAEAPGKSSKNVTDAKSGTAGGASGKAAETAGGAASGSPIAGAGTAGAPGTVAGTAGAAGTADASAGTAAKPEPPKPECFTMNFKHKALAAHRDGEACLSHDNAFKIPHERLNPKTLCVRVNGTPVRHRLVKNKPGVVMIGAVAGPESVVTVRWCTDKTTCKEDCSVPKDEFMDAIGGMGGGDAYVQWDPSDSRKGPSDDEKRLEKELQAFGGGKNEVFDQWIAEREPKLTCGTEKLSAAGSGQSGDRSVANR